MYDTWYRKAHVKETHYFNAHSFHQNTFRQVTNINVYQQQQQHYSISSYITRRTGLSHLRPSRTSINSSVVSQCMRSTQYYYRHLLSISGEFQLYLQIKYSSSSSSIDVNSESYFLPYSWAFPYVDCLLKTEKSVVHIYVTHPRRYIEKKHVCDIIMYNLSQTRLLHNSVP